MHLQCRFYEDIFPALDDTVMVYIQETLKMGSSVQLVEYNNINGMILHSELSRRRIRSLNKLAPIGVTVPVTVIRVDEDRQYIDLSKRLVVERDVAMCKERYATSKTVNQILRHVAEKLGYQTNEEFEELYQKTAWHFDRKMKRKGAAYDVFKTVVNDPSILDECDIDEKTRELLLIDIRHRLMPKVVKIRADFEVSCFTEEGINAIKSALEVGLAFNNDEDIIHINLIAPPLFIMTTQKMNADQGLKLLDTVLNAIKASIEERNGSFKIQTDPRVVSDIDDAHLKRQMEDLEHANKEVSGDDEDDDDDDEDEEVED